MSQIELLREEINRVCEWCGTLFPAKTVGAHPKRFCCDACKGTYHTALRRWAQREVDEGRITITDLKAAVSSCTTREMQ